MAIFCGSGKLFQTVVVLSVLFSYVLCADDAASEDDDTFSCPPVGAKDPEYYVSEKYPKDDKCKSYWKCHIDDETGDVSYAVQQCPAGQLFLRYDCFDEKNVDCPPTFKCETDVGNFPDDKDEKRYYYCRYKAPLHMTCPVKETFSKDFKECLPNPDDVCKKEENKGKVSKVHSTDKSCQYYVDCKGDKKIHKCGDKQRYQFEGQKNGCVKDKEIDCEKPAKCETKDAIMPLKKSKSKYIKCEEFSPFIKPCDKNKVFDADKKECVPKPTTAPKSG